MSPTNATAPSVFISYARKNKEIAEEIVRHLKEFGASVWIDQRIEAGSQWNEEIVKALKASDAVVVLLSRASVESEYVARELRFAENHGIQIIPLRIEPYGLASTATEFNLGRIQHLEAYDAVARRSACRRVLALLAPDAALEDEPVGGGSLSHADCPYLGPLSFSAENADLFYGRDKDLERALNLIGEAKERLIMVHGPSGTGKTSFVQAALLPALAKRSFFTPPPMRIVQPPGAGKIEHVWVREQITDPGAPARIATLADLRDAMIGRKSQLEERFKAGTILFFDQFEEIFNLGYPEFIQAQCFSDLRNALAAFPRLRVVLVFREEYLAQIQRSYEARFARSDAGVATPAGPPYAHVTLVPMDIDFAVQAIRNPSRNKCIEFDGSVATSIARELQKVTLLEGGVPVEKDRKEHVEPVHLQIVCQRLWTHLRQGISHIDRTEVANAIRRALGDRADLRGTSFETLLVHFVAGVLNQFYSDTVKAAIEAPEAKAVGFTEQLIQLGCLQFVTAGGHRALIQRDEEAERVGRLPFWAARVLEDCHFVRADQRGTSTWYELAHDKLTEPVQRASDAEAHRLLAALETLSAALKRSSSGANGLSGVFQENDSVLRGLEQFIGKPGLFADEAEFVLRSALKSGYRLIDWTRGLSGTFESQLLAVLQEGLKSADDDVRANAVRVVCARQHRPGDWGASSSEQWSGLEDAVFQLGLEDPAPRVRAASADGLANLARPEHAERLRSATVSKSQPARELFSRIRNLQEQRANSELFETTSKKLGAGDRLKIFWFISRLRFRDSFRGVLLISLVSGLFTAAITFVARGLMANFGLTLTQAEFKPTMGAFHGLTGGIGWGFSIPLAVILSWEVLHGGRPWRSWPRMLLSTLLGGIAGVVSGLALTMVIINVFTAESLLKQGWIYRDATRISDALFVTRMGNTMLVQGFFVGIGCAMGLFCLCKTARWQEFMRAARPEDQNARKRPILIQFAKWALPYSAIHACSLVVGGFVLKSIMQPNPEKFFQKLENLTYMIAGDGLSIVFGGFALLLGTSYGYFMNVTGYTIEARQGILPENERKS